MTLSVNEREFVYEQKFRPTTIEEMVLPKSLRDKFDGFLAEGSIPNLCLYSPCPGTGKTTTARALATAVGCKKVLFINASLQTDIANIRENVYTYATGSSLYGGKKVVILDEVERLSQAAQESLKGLMEQVSKNCVFILTTNNISRIVAPLVSRCRVVKYMWTAEETNDMKVQMCRRCVDILKHEGVTLDPSGNKVIVALVNQYFPDNRQLLGTLQEFVTEHGQVNEGILAQIKAGSLDDLIECMKKKEFGKVKQWVTDNADTLGGDFYPRMTRVLIGNGEQHPAKVSKSAIVTVIDFLGEEQKYHNVADIWLHTLRVLTCLMMELEGQWV